MTHFSHFDPPAHPLGLARALAYHLRYGAWAQDDKQLVQLATQHAAFLDANQWSETALPGHVEFVEALLLKAIDSDWSWEVSPLTGYQPAEFAVALDQYRAERASI